MAISSDNVFCRIRLLHPFFFEDSLTVAVAALVKSGQWKAHGCVPGKYLDNMLPIIRDQLFVERFGVGRYLTATDESCRLLADRSIEVAGQKLLIDPSADTAIELFITSAGVGLLSLSLTLRQEQAPADHPSIALVAGAVNKLHHGKREGRDAETLADHSTAGRPTIFLDALAESLVSTLKPRRTRRSFLAYTAHRLPANVLVVDAKPDQVAAVHALREKLLALQAARSLDFTHLVEQGSDSRVFNLTDHQVFAVGHDGAATFLRDIDGNENISSQLFEDADGKQFFAYLLSLLQRSTMYRLSERTLVWANQPRWACPMPGG